MKEKLSKNLIIQILFAIAVVLLIANLLVDRFNNGRKIKRQIEFDSQVTPAVADSIFLSTLKSFNIKDGWIKKSKSQKNSSKPDLFLYNIDIPANLPNILIIKDLYQNFSHTKLKITSKETKEDQTSLLEIYNANKLFLSALLNYNKDISHLVGSINLIVVLPNDIDSDKIKPFLDLNRSITYLFTPSNKNLILAEEIIINKASYGLIIDNNIEELNFKIRNNFDIDRIENGVNAVLKAFPNYKLFYFPKEFSPNNKIKNVFKKNKIRTFNSKIPINLTSDYKTNFNKIFNSYILNSNPKDTLDLVLDSDNFIKIIPDLKMISKLGYRFVTY
ncbi:MAG: hypothetical protein CO128_09265 [Ignavibacteriales bacterium CG_4_9_14_3_um_filter_30_11]|nr:MAG: hypothetical protein CO128_09265 [Ignavibacteriales bacterium CG_4_9_14_3_um_filter_30_11]